MEIGMSKKYIVRLTRDERDMLEAMVAKGKTQAYKIKHANILLTADVDGPAWKDAECAKAFRCHLNTVHDIREQFVLGGFDAAIQRKKQVRPSRQNLLDGEGEARLQAVACSKPPKGRNKWTLQMLADELVVLNVVDSISGQTVRRTLKKMCSNLTCDNVG
jgi:homeodomain-containing protein